MPPSSAVPKRLDEPRLDDRRVARPIGIARGVLADDELRDEEIAFLHRWLAAQEGLTTNPVVRDLVVEIEGAGRGGTIDEEENSVRPCSRRPKLCTTQPRP